jgi:hypothetical protein
MPKKTAAAKKAKASRKAKPGRPKRAAGRKTAGKKAVAKKTAAKKAAGKKTVAKKAAGRKAVAKKVAVKKAASKRVASKKVASKKVASKKAASKKVAGKKVAGKKVAGKKVAGRKVAGKRAARSGAAAAGRTPRAPKRIHGTLRDLESRLLAIPSRDVLAPGIPVERLVAEGVELATVAWRDLAKLTSAGLDRSIVVDLGLRSQALSEAQAELVAARSRGRTSEEEDLIAESTELRSEVLAAGRLALRRDPIAQSRLDDIMEGEGLDDLLQDLQDLAGLLRTYSRDFARVGLKPAELASWSETLRLRLGKHLAERRAGDATTAAAKDLRDRAATLLAEAVAVTRLTGAYVFRKDPRRLLHYRSGYNAETRARAARRRQDDPTPTPADPAATPKPHASDDK